MNKILVVEDEKLIAGALKRKLESNHFIVAMASDGREALEKVSENPPDLILLDIIMPIVDGISFIKTIKKTEYKDIPIIILTNLTDDKVVSEAIKHGVTDFLIKVDYSLDRVVSVIKNKLEME